MADSSARSTEHRHRPLRIEDVIQPGGLSRDQIIAKARKTDEYGGTEEMTLREVYARFGYDRAFIAGLIAAGGLSYRIHEDGQIGLFRRDVLPSFRGEEPFNKSLPQPLPREPDVVYFVEAPTVGLIKIGWSGWFENRLAGLRTGSPVPLIVLGRVPGTLKSERKIHALFAACRRHGEWFEATDDLRAFIADVVAKHGIGHDG